MFLHFLWILEHCTNIWRFFPNCAAHLVLSTLKNNQILQNIRRKWRTKNVHSALSPQMKGFLCEKKWFFFSQIFWHFFLPFNSPIQQWSSFCEIIVIKSFLRKPNSSSSLRSKSKIARARFRFDLDMDIYISWSLAWLSAE